MGRLSRTSLPSPSSCLTVSDELADQALEVLQPYAPRALTREDARTMAGRLARFAEILMGARGPACGRGEQ